MGKKKQQQQASKTTVMRKRSIFQYFKTCWTEISWLLKVIFYLWIFNSSLPGEPMVVIWIFMSLLDISPNDSATAALDVTQYSIEV